PDVACRDASMVTASRAIARSRAQVQRLSHPGQGRTSHLPCLAPDVGLRRGAGSRVGIFPNVIPRLRKYLWKYATPAFSQNASIFVRDPSCTPPRGSLDSPVRRPRSAARSKPAARAVRGSRKAKPESQRDGWTKAPPGRRTSGPVPKARDQRAEGQASACPSPGDRKSVV